MERRLVKVICAIVLMLSATAGWAARPTQTVLRSALDNGLRVIIVRNPLAPVVTTAVNYRAGSNEAPPGFPGMAHAEEHMMFRGDRTLSANQLANITAAMGSDFDADTQQEVTQYFFTVPADDLPLALRIEAGRMQSILDSKALWDQERGAIEQEVAQDLSNPEYVFYTKLLAVLFKGTPYAHDALGTRPSFDQTTGAMLRKFHRDWYTPNNATLIILGDVDPPAALEKVRQLFGHLHRAKLPPRSEVNLRPVQPELLQFKTDLPYGLAVIAFCLPGYANPDFAAADVLCDVLGNKRGRLYALVPEGKALEVECSYDPLTKAGIGYVSATFPKGGDGAAVIAAMKQALSADLTNGFPADLVEAEKRHEAADAEFEKNSISDAAMAWSQAVAVEGRQSPDDDIIAIRTVSVADVNRVAHQYLDFDHAITAILTPEESGKPVSTRAFGGHESFAPSQTKPVKLPGWAAKALNKLVVPESTVHPVVTTLPNGLQLIVQSETINHTVSVYGHIKNRWELEAPPGQEGVADVIDKLFSYGTHSLDRVAFQKALDDIGARESAGTDFSLQVLATDFSRGLQLLADNELHPAFPPAAFKVVQQQVADTVAGRLLSPDYLTKRALRAALYPKHDPMQRQATPETVRALTLDDVKDYCQRVFRPDLATIVVIGDITPQQAQAAVAQYFGDWKTEGPKPETSLPPVPLNPASSAAVPDTSRVQDKVLLAETLGLVRSNADYYPLQLGNHVLGGAFYATRLYRDLREESGLVYFVESIFEIEQTRSVYAVEYACDPPNVSKARDLVMRDLKEMRTVPVTAAELRQAQALLLREIPLNESSIAKIGHGLLNRATHDLPLDEPTRAAHRYVSLTAAQVQAAFAKWLRPDALVQVTEGPPPR
ncbi:MAG TPA: pitrilysin family protein [Verrucomicrobiae bacterium]|nr:pitrilysin family protein [Verrucomicrobiae bacterium]